MIHHAISQADIRAHVQQAIDEDLGEGDITVECLGDDSQTTAQLIVREACVLAGQAWFETSFKLLDESCAITWFFKDGEGLAAGQVVCEIKAKAKAILSGERTAINFLQTLSATATITATYVKKMNQPDVKLLDTRKTIPGLRKAQKYAVVCGGGANHRQGLWDAFLIKENHIAVAGGIPQAIAAARAYNPTIFCQVEVETLDECAIALAAQPDALLLDNFDVSQLREAAAMAQSTPHIKLEASGNIDLDNIAEVAKTGVHAISVGALTKHIHAIDFSMRVS